ncbi:MAG: glycosyltransferase family 4 protein [Anaerolineae bacterium]|nr:glycosyltransferase family 4 protein [Anaerolineae bacterium]
MIRVSFFMEQHVGHRTFYNTLREYIGRDIRIKAKWTEITYTDPQSNWGKIPYLTDNLRGTLIGRQQVRRSLLAHESDIAFFSTQVPAVLSGSVLEYCPYVLCTDITPIQYDTMGNYYNHRPDKNGVIGAYKYRANTKVFNKAAHIVPWSNWTKHSLLNDYGVAPSKITVVPVGVDVELWKPKEVRSDKPVRFLFVGGDFYRKGGDLLLKAFRQLPAELAELTLVTRENIPEEENIRTYHNLQPNSPELIALFQESDVFVLPSRAEAYGIVTIEAGATGLPIIMTDIGSARELVGENQNGFLIEVGNVQQLYDRMCCMIENPGLRRNMGQNARQRVEQYFNAQKNVAQIADILLEVATKQRTR